MKALRKTFYFKFMAWLIISIFMFQVDFLLPEEDNLSLQFNKAVNEYKKQEYVKAKVRLVRLSALLGNIIEPTEKDKQQLGQTHLLLGACYENLSEPVKAEEKYKAAFALSVKELSTYDLKLKNLEIYKKNYKEFKKIKEKKIEIPQAKIITNEAIKVKKKKFPILLVIGGVILVGGLAVLVSKKKTSTKGSINIQTVPDGADIWLDGQNTGRKSNTILDNISVGTHAIKFIKTGYENYEQTINVTNGQQTLVQVNLQKIDNVPSITFTNLVENQHVSGTYVIEVAASDDNGIQRVEFYVNYLLRETDYSAPYSYRWNTTLLSNRSWYVQAIAYDTAGKSAEVHVNVVVNN